tara:strand:- start:259 stop:444 length:186 start_codon:yes stop_codon:yes gene_type:complete
MLYSSRPFLAGAHLGCGGIIHTEEADEPELRIKKETNTTAKHSHIITLKYLLMNFCLLQKA